MRIKDTTYSEEKSQNNITSLPDYIKVKVVSSAFVFSNTQNHENSNVRRRKHELRGGTHGDENATTRNYDGKKMQKYDVEGISWFRLRTFVFFFVVLPCVHVFELIKKRDDCNGTL